MCCDVRDQSMTSQYDILTKDVKIMPFGKKLKNFLLCGHFSVDPIDQPLHYPPIRMVDGQSAVYVRDGHDHIQCLVLTKKLKQGATSDVYAGYVRTQQRHLLPNSQRHLVAVKVVKKGYKSILLREYRVLRGLKHANIIKALKFQFSTDNENPRVFMQMEYAQKGNLFDYVIDRIDPPEEDIRNRWKRELITAMEYIHTLDIVIGDLTCESVLLDADLTVKVSDFGSASAKDGYIVDYIEDDYMPPELYVRQYKSLPDGYDPRAIDVWSVGIILFYTLTARFPFDNTSLDDCIVHQNRPVNTLLEEEEVSRAGPSYLALLEKLIDFNPKRRATMHYVVTMKYFEDHVPASVIDTGF